jgi:cytochrome c oxidase cbb3-type subunit 3
MSNEKDPLLLDHEADGIRELDNKLPRWWVWLFYLTIAFAPAYLVYYHVWDIGDLSEVAYAKEMKVGNAVKLESMRRFEAKMAELNPSEDLAVVNQGQQIFANLCAPCHRANGGGLVGPNLTDDYWIHGNAFADNVKVIWDGVPEKGMLTWKGILKPDEIQAVASFVYTMRGKNVADGKPPENQQAAPAENVYE